MVVQVIINHHGMKNLECVNQQSNITFRGDLVAASSGACVVAGLFVPSDIFISVATVGVCLGAADSLVSASDVFTSLVTVAAFCFARVLRLWDCDNRFFLEASCFDTCFFAPATPEVSGGGVFLFLRAVLLDERFLLIVLRLGLAFLSGLLLAQVDTWSGRIWSRKKIKAKKKNMCSIEHFDRTFLVFTFNSPRTFSQLLLANPMFVAEYFSPQPPY